MNDQIETAVETAPIQGIALGRTSSVVVISLAAYGAVSLTRDVTGKVKSIFANRKAAKASEVEPDSTEK